MPLPAPKSEEGRPMEGLAVAYLKAWGRKMSVVAWLGV
jgi:hypothetical protein